MVPSGRFPGLRSGAGARPVCSGAEGNRPAPAGRGWRGGKGEGSKEAGRGAGCLGQVVFEWFGRTNC